MPKKTPTVTQKLFLRTSRCPHIYLRIIFYVYKMQFLCKHFSIFYKMHTDTAHGIAIP